MTDHFYIKIITFIVLIIIFSCSDRKHQPEVFWLQQFGHNKVEVEKVIKKYSKERDSLKRKAACSLFDNMEDKKYYSGSAYANFLQFIDSVWSTDVSREGFAQLLRVYNGKHASLVGKLTEKYDWHTIKANHLVEHIDVVFEAWENTSWHSCFTFEEFCEYVLPYRIGDEPLVDYRGDYYAYYRPILDGKGKNCLIGEAAGYLLEHAFPFTMELIDYPAFCPCFDPLLLKKIKAGRCMDYVGHAVAVMSSVGIPAAIDFIPQWPDRSGSHSWGVVLTEDKKITDFEGAGVKQLGGHILPSTKLAKVYRKTYAKQANSLALLSDEPVPEFFRSPYFYDVSHQYFEGADIKINF